MRRPKPHIEVEKMEKNKDCKHDFLAVLACKKCGEQFHTNWPEAAKQAKLDAVAEVLQRTKSTIKMKSKGDVREKATEIALDALEEVKKVYEKAIGENQKEATNIALKAAGKEKNVYEGKIS